MEDKFDAKGKKCGKGFVSAKKKCKRSSVGSTPDGRTEKKGKGSRAAALGVSLGVGVPLYLGAGSLMLHGMIAEGMPNPKPVDLEDPLLSRTAYKEPSEGEYVPEKSNWSQPGHLSRNKIERILRNTEDSIRNRDSEWVGIIDGRTGKVVLPLKTDGKGQSVSIPPGMANRNTVVTHNHPQPEDGKNYNEAITGSGCSFSPEDISIAIRNTCEIRAVTRDWTYSFRVDWGEYDKRVEQKRKEAVGAGLPTEGIEESVKSEMGYDRIRTRHEELNMEYARKTLSRVLKGEPPLTGEEMTHGPMMDLAKEFKDLGFIYEARRRDSRLDSGQRAGSTRKSLQACSSIRGEVSEREDGGSKGVGLPSAPALGACAQIRADTIFLRDLERNEQGQVKYQGQWYTPNEPKPATQKGKKRQVLAVKEGQAKLVSYGAKGYKHNYSEEAKANYLKRAGGIRDKSGKKTKDDKFSANYWAMKDLWPKDEPADGSARDKS